MKRFFSIPKFSRFQSEDVNSDDFDLKSLREAIKKRYNSYNAEDGIRFPVFDYNTNRRNYETLKESFEEDFYARRGVSRTNNNLHIPSTNTLALFFTDDSYKPSRKILNTLLAYADNTNEKIRNQSILNQTIVRNHNTLIKASVVLAVTLFFSYKVFIDNSSQLEILTPKTNESVSRMLAIEGKTNFTSGNDTKNVWIVVKSKMSGICYVQAPISIQRNGSWKGNVIIGREGNGDVGFAYEIKALLNPQLKIKEGDTSRIWPSAEVSTEIIRVVRGVNPVADLQNF
jgi:hypothetical protein